MPINTVEVHLDRPRQLLYNHNALADLDMVFLRDFGKSVFQIFVSFEKATAALEGLAEDDVAGMMEITEEMGPIPPHWGVYFGVDDADAAVKKAESLGGSIIIPAMDIPEIGRFAGIQDPQGAMFSVFQPAG